MVGIGGAIVNYPMLLYIPPLLGLAAFTAHQVTGIVAMQVLFSTLSGVIAYQKGGYLQKDVILSMGISMLVGSTIGSLSSNFFPEYVINIIYGILAILAVVMMLIPKKKQDETEEAPFNVWMAVGSSVLVGTAAGIIGAGGAFLLVPIMLTVLKLPMRVAIGSSMAITFISSIGTAAGKIATHQVLWLPSLVVILVSVVASPLGVRTGQKLNAKVLQWTLAALILAIAIKIWMDILIAAA